MFKCSFGIAGLLAGFAIGTLSAGAAAGPGSPVLSGSYGWEDGVGTILGSFGNLANPTNVEAEAGIMPNTGTRMLRLTEAPHSGTPQGYVAFIEGLEDGDIITASFASWDDTPGASPALRIWGHYGVSGDIDSFNGSAGGNNDFSSGIGWEELSHTWTFDSNNGERDALIIEVRLYSDPATCPECSTDYYVDDIIVDVFCAENPNLTITFPDGSIVSGPGTPGPDCVDPEPCDTPNFFGDYGWEDGKGTVFQLDGTGTIDLAENIDTNGGEVNTGQRALRMSQSNPSGTPQAWVAYIENLQDGDEIDASVFVYDTTPGQGNSGYPSYRIWAHYAVSGDPGSTAGSAGGNNTYSDGIGWEELSHSWTFDSNEGQRDALMIEVRLYTETADTEYFVDDLSVQVCSTGQNVQISFPDSVEPPPPPVDPCDTDKLGEPDLAGPYGWEDGKGTITGSFTSGNENLQWNNVTESGGILPNSGARMLRLTESPHAGTPEGYFAFIEGLQDGDIIFASFYVYDDTPDFPSARIWAHFAESGDPQSFRGSAGGNETYSAGIGWERICYSWVFDSGTVEPLRDAFTVKARLYSTPATCKDCTTDYLIDDLDVLVFSANPNVTITYPDGSVIGDPGQPCPADVNGDNEVDVIDLFAIEGDWGTSNESTDINADGLVDGADLGLALAYWGPCGALQKPIEDANLELAVSSQAAGLGQTEYSLYAQLDDPDDTVVNVYDGNFTFPKDFDPFSAVVTIGVDPPNFDIFQDPNFIFGGGITGENVGWYNSNPPSEIGRAGDYANNQVLLAKFTVATGQQVQGTLSLTYTGPAGQPIYGTSSFDTAAAPSCPEDLNDDNAVNVLDLLAVLSDWGACPGCASDLNEDDVVNVLDMLAVLSAWGACP